MNIAVEFYKRHGKIPSRYLVHEFRDNSVLRTIMKLPPVEQLKSIQKRGKNLVLTNKWNELTSDSHDKAFTVAKVMSADLLQEIYNHVEQAKRDGWTLDEFRKNLLPKLESAGWVGANPSRLKVIYETNMQVAYAKERYKQHKLVSDEYPYWRYEQVERITKNHDHSKYHNKIFRHDDPIWSSIYPPSAFGCKCTVTPMSEDDVQGMTISKGTDFKDIEPPNLDLLKAWEPKTDKYVTGIKKQLESMLSQRSQLTPLSRDDEAVKFGKHIVANIKSTVNHEVVDRNLFEERVAARYKKNAGKMLKYFDDVTDRLNSLMLADETKLSIRVSEDALKMIINDGRFKSQFETSTSGGLLNKDVRVKVESQLFGYDKNTPDKFRPIYGYFRDGSIGKGKGQDSTEDYGEIIVVLKNSKKEMSTMVVGDSLGFGRRQAPYKAGEFKTESLFGSVNIGEWGGKEVREYYLPGEFIIDTIIKTEAKDLTLKQLTNLGGTPNYIEAQIHGQVTLDDVDYIEISSPNPKIEALAKLKGIKVIIK